MEAKKKKVTKGSNFCSNSLPVDLMIEIFRRLPLKTLTRLISVSKLWASVVRNRDFMNLFLKESFNKPRGLVLMFREYPVSNLSSEHPRFETHESSPSNASLATYHVTCLARQDTFIAPSSVHGLICYRYGSTLGIYNPCTRRSITLPKLNSERTVLNQDLGFDPIDNDYKVLSVTRAATKPKGNTRALAKEMWVLTLGSEISWKRFNQEYIPRHSPISQDLCINGVLYYRAVTGSKLKNSAIMSFDVRSERLNLIKAEKLDITIRPRKFRNFSKLTCYLL
ncbi:unnamed protein product [Microthlaspi erraticum]|uniref:F-box domain-containing protein n=1 Tax=Microthlaspi erraticum TaxID=1685480 RepID=A0A6D2ILP8_9BRAS|nr:unnamed protein product [Microthlaspi erraticum]